MNCIHWQSCGLLNGAGCCRHPKQPWGEFVAPVTCERICKKRVEGEPMPALPAKKRGLGDWVEAAVKPLGRALGLDCYQKDGSLKPTSKCAERRDKLNKLSGASPKPRKASG